MSQLYFFENQSGFWCTKFRRPQVIREYDDWRKALGQTSRHKSWQSDNLHLVKFTTERLSLTQGENYDEALTW